MAKERVFICNRFPNLGIPPFGQFYRGSFATSDEKAIKFLKGHEWYGVHILPQDPEDDAAAPIAEGESEDADATNKQPRKKK